MSGRVESKVAFITGAARGQGRSHATRLAQEGADIIAVDLCGPVANVPYAPSTPEDLEQTVKEVEALGRRIVAQQADVRDIDALQAVVARGVDELGRLDIVCANAGITSHGPAHELDEARWQDVIDINLTGVWHAAKAAVPAMIAGGRGGSIVLTSSVAGVRAYEHLVHYNAAKHGVIGIMRTLALELAPDMIRVNTVNPSAVNTDMVHNPELYALFRPDLENPGLDDVLEVFLRLNALPTPFVEPLDISNAVLFLASDEARYVTGVVLPVDAGALLK